MGYIENPRHFTNILNKALEKAAYGVDYSKLLPSEFYTSNIYRKGDGEAFTWALRQQGAQLLEEDNTLDWMARHSHGVRFLLKKQSFTQHFTDLYQEVVEDLELASGIYTFCREDDKILYIGKSIHLGQRIATSEERFREYNKTLYLRYIIAKSKSDIALLEAYFIAKHKPSFNQDGNFSDSLSYVLDPIPKWSSRVKVYEVTYTDES